MYKPPRAIRSRIRLLRCLRTTLWVVMLALTVGEICIIKWPLLIQGRTDLHIVYVSASALYLLAFYYGEEYLGYKIKLLCLDPTSVQYWNLIEERKKRR